MSADNFKSDADAEKFDAWIDSLLRSPITAELESAPVTLHQSLHTALTQRRRRVRRDACGLAAAAAILIAVGSFALIRQAPRPAAPETQSVAVIAVATASAPEAPRATFTTNGDTIAIPLESPSPEVTIVQLFPTTDTERRWRLELALETNHKQHNGG